MNISRLQDFKISKRFQISRFQDFLVDEQYVPAYFVVLVNIGCIQEGHLGRVDLPGLQGGLQFDLVLQQRRLMCYVFMFCHIGHIDIGRHIFSNSAKPSDRLFGR